MLGNMRNTIDKYFKVWNKYLIKKILTKLAGDPCTTPVCIEVRPSLALHWLIYPSLTTHQLLSDFISWSILLFHSFSNIYVYTILLSYLSDIMQVNKSSNNANICKKKSSPFLQFLNSRHFNTNHINGCRYAYLTWFSLKSLSVQPLKI